MFKRMGEGEEMRSKKNLKRQNVWDEWTYTLAKRARAKDKYKGVKVGVVEIVEGGDRPKRPPCVRTAVAYMPQWTLAQCSWAVKRLLVKYEGIFCHSRVKTYFCIYMEGAVQ